MFDDILKRVEAMDWPSLGTHVYNHPKYDIPTAFKHLASADNEAARNILGYLMGNEQDTGSVYDTTPYIVPFLMDFLKAGFPHPEHILNCLAATCIFHVQHGITIQEMRQRVSIYETVAAELELLHELLQAPDAKVRREAASLLRCFSDKAEIVATWLRNHYLEEDNLSVKRMVIRSLCMLMANLPNYDRLREQLGMVYRPFFEEIALKSPNPALKREAAQAFLVLCGNNQKLVSKQILDALIEGFSAEAEIDDFIFDATSHLFELRKLRDYYWLELANKLQLSLESTKLLINGIRNWPHLNG
jgi:hypothetical protein